jgi:hypothetical protein
MYRGGKTMIWIGIIIGAVIGFVLCAVLVDKDGHKMPMIIEKLNKLRHYGFRDKIGHPLETCEDFISIYRIISDQEAYNGMG